MFREEHKIVSQNHHLGKAQKQIPKATDLLHFCLEFLVFQITEKSIRYQLDYLKKMTYSASTSQILEQIFLLI